MGGSTICKKAGKQLQIAWHCKKQKKNTYNSICKFSDHFLHNIYPFVNPNLQKFTSNHHLHKF